jgi:hypothetical protein
VLWARVVQDMSRRSITQRSLTQGSIDISHSQALEPVCDRLKSLFEPAAVEPMPVDLKRVMEALDDALSRGDLFRREKKRG